MCLLLKLLALLLSCREADFLVSFFSGSSSMVYIPTELSRFVVIRCCCVILFLLEVVIYISNIYIYKECANANTCGDPKNLGRTICSQ